MCRSIKTLHNLDPEATSEEITAASIQFVRKITGYRNPSKVNKKAYTAAVKEISKSTQHLLASLQTNSDPKPRDLPTHSH